MNTTDGTPPQPRPGRVKDTSTAAERSANSKQVRAARRAAGLTQTQLAQAVGVGTRVVSRIENGHRVDDRSREDVEAYLGLREPRAGEHPSPFGAAGTGVGVDLTAVPSIALLAELLHRESQSTRRIGPTPNGPPERIRWKTADGPTESHTSGQPQQVQPDTEEG